MSPSSLLPTHVPLFPLPEVVLFPRQVLPLHIFEPRYRAMVTDVLDAGGRIAVALLRPGFEHLYFTPKAPIHRVIGVGQIVTAERLADGRFNLLLRGIGRAEVRAEDCERSYRVARIDAIETSCALQRGEQCRLRETLWEAVTAGALCSKSAEQSVARLFQADVPFGALIDLLSSGVPVDAEIRQQLLEELDDGQRAQMLLDSLATVNAVHAAQAAMRCTRPCHPN